MDRKGKKKKRNGSGDIGDMSRLRRDWGWEPALSTLVCSLGACDLFSHTYTWPPYKHGQPRSKKRNVVPGSHCPEMSMKYLTAIYCVCSSRQWRTNSLFRAAWGWSVVPVERAQSEDFSGE